MKISLRFSNFGRTILLVRITQSTDSGLEQKKLFGMGVNMPPL
jgi:hypothetical protein